MKRSEEHINEMEGRFVGSIGACAGPVLWAVLFDQLKGVAEVLMSYWEEKKHQ